MSSRISSYKDEHESFVSNLKGTSVACVVTCLAHVPAFIMLAKMMQRTRKPRIIREFLCLSLPLLLTITVFADYSYLSLAILGITLGVLNFQHQKHLLSDLQTGKMDGTKQQMDDKNDRTAYLTLSKGATVLLTCLAILAVDFRIFPRRFGKTETFGVSLMDYGVGSFIISTACTSKYARGVGSGGLREVINWRRFAVLVLGVVRLVTIKLLNYQEHVSEYGVHWNFFVTLFCVWSVADVIHGLLSRKWVFVLAAVLLCAYQVALSHLGVTDYVFSADRRNFFDQNKEGFVSLCGYIPLYLIAEVLSFYAFHSDTDASYRHEYDTMYSAVSTDDLEVQTTKNKSFSTALDMISPEAHPHGSSAAKSHTYSVPTTISCNNSKGLAANSIGANANVSYSSKKRGHSFAGHHHQSSHSYTVESNIEATSTGDSSSVIDPRFGKSDEDTCGSGGAVHPLVVSLSEIEASTLGNDDVHGNNTAPTTSGISSAPMIVSGSDKVTGRHYYHAILDSRFVRRLAVLVGVLWILWLVSAALCQPTSRRLCNPTYVLFALALSFLLILLTYLADIYGGHYVPLQTLHFMNKHSLIVFLGANVLTGLVNLSFRTIYAVPIQALAILAVYSLVVTGLPWVVDYMLTRSSPQHPTVSLGSSVTSASASSSPPVK